MRRLALIAGEGALPGAVIAGLSGDWAAFRPEGCVTVDIEAEPFRLERLGGLLERLRDDGFDSVCFAGRASRPAFDPAALDDATLRIASRIVLALGRGDGAALRVLLELFEEAGLHIVAPQEASPSLLALPERGVPTDRDLADMSRAIEVHTALAPLDIGQGCVVAGGLTLGVEALPGTDRMLAGLVEPFARPPGGVLLKAAKPGQDRRIDLPAIGPATVRAAAAAGLNGIAVMRGDVLVLDADGISATLDETGLFLAGLPQCTSS